MPLSPDVLFQLHMADVKLASSRAVLEDATYYQPWAECFRKEAGEHSDQAVNIASNEEFAAGASLIKTLKVMGATITPDSPLARYLLLSTQSE